MSDPNVWSAKLRVMQAVPYLQKRKVSNGPNYPIVSEAQFLEALRPAMVAEGLTLSPVQATLVGESTYKTAAGATWNLVRVAVTYHLTHGASQTHQPICTLAEGADPGDKAVAKALTMAMKYALRQAFMVETGLDADKYPSVGRAEAPTEREPGEDDDEAGELAGPDLLARIQALFTELQIGPEKQKSGLAKHGTTKPENLKPIQAREVIAALESLKAKRAKTDSPAPAVASPDVATAGQAVIADIIASIKQNSETWEHWRELISNRLAKAGVPPELRGAAAKPAKFAWYQALLHACETAEDVAQVVDQAKGEVAYLGETNVVAFRRDAAKLVQELAKAQAV